MSTKQFVGTDLSVYEQGLARELVGISALRDTHVDYYACNPGLGYILVCHDHEGYYLIENRQGFTTSGGPWTQECACEGFLEGVNFLGGES